MKKILSFFIFIFLLTTATYADSDLWQEGVLDSGIRYVANTVRLDLSFKDQSSSVARLMGDGALALFILEDGRFVIIQYESDGEALVNTSGKALSCKVYIRDGDDEHEYFCDGVQEVNTNYQVYSGDLISCIREMEKPCLIYKYSLGFTDTTVNAEQICQILNLEELLSAYDNMMASIADSNAA